MMKLKNILVTEGFKSEYEGNDGIIWKRGKKLRGGGYNFTPYYKGHDIDKGGHNFGTEKELKDFIKDYILSNQLYNKYRFESEDINEVGVFPVTNYIKGIIPQGRLDTNTPENRKKSEKLVKDLRSTLNKFWKDHDIPFKIK